MVVKPGYKLTEIGVIPEEWEEIQLKNCINLKNGYAFESAFYSDRGMILLTPGNFSRTGGLLFDLNNTKRYCGKYPQDSVLLKGDLLLVMTDLTPDCKLLGKPALVINEEHLLHNQRIAKVLNNEKTVLNNYLFYVFLSDHYLRYLKDRATGSTVRHTSLSIISSVNISLPSKEEQIAIVKYLTDIDSLITSLEKLIEKKKNIKQGAMQELLTGKRRLPGFSGEWEITIIDTCCHILKGRGLSKSQLTSDGLHDCILYGELFTTYNDVIEEIYSSTNSNDGVESIAGDILLPGSTTTTGIDLAKASALLQDGVRLGGDINILRPKRKLDSSFFAMYLNVVKRNAIAEKTKGITIHHLHGNDIKNIIVKLPSLSEQIAISTIIKTSDVGLHSLENQLSKYRLIKQGMMQELLTGRIRLI